MSQPVIRVEGLGKEYVIGGRESGRETFREMLTSSFATPFRRLRQLKGEVAPEERIWALKDVSFEVAEGEVVGIIGRNGAGKSTLLKILSRITEPTEGRVEIRGRVASLLEVGTGFHPELTGRENIYLNGAILGMTRAEIDRKFDEIVDFSEVEQFLDTPVKRYSSGMHVRLAFAVAANLDQDILLVDEVLAVGDVVFQQKCSNKMKTVARSGRTILFVSHNMNAIRRLCSKVILIQSGKLIEIGTPDSVMSNYLGSQESLITRKNEEAILLKEHKYLKKVDILNIEKKSTGVIPYEESFEVRILYIAPGDHWSFIVAVRLIDELGNVIFTSWDSDAISRDGVIPGQCYEEKCVLPAQLLKPGRYNVATFIRRLAHGTVWGEEMVDLYVEISELGFVQGQRRWGVVAPRLHWEIKPVL